jgi:hypothetical protein
MVTTKIKNNILFIDGKPIFPLISNRMCFSGFNCSPDNSFDFNIEYWSKANWPKGINQIPFQKKYEQAGVGWTACILDGEAEGDEISKTSNIKNSTWFFGYSQEDEPDLRNISVSLMKSRYDRIKKNDPDHIVYTNVYGDIEKYAPTADVLAFDAYPIRKGYNRQDFAPRWEQAVFNHVFHYKSLESIGKPIYAVLQVVGAPTESGSILVMTPEELRLQAFTAITMGCHGLVYWVYHAYGSSGDVGHVINPTLHKAIQTLNAEIRSYNSYLVKPTIANSWEGKKTDKTVQITPNPAVKISTGLFAQTFNYILKPGVLIVINKLNSQIDNVSIKVLDKEPFSTNFKPYEIKIWKEGQEPDPQDEPGEPKMIEYTNKTGSITTSDPAIPTVKPISIIMRTKINSISPTKWAIMFIKSGSWGLCITPANYKDGHAKSGKLVFEITDIADLFSTIDVRNHIGLTIHIAAVLTANKCEFYLNGELINSISHTATPITGGTIYPDEPYFGYTDYARIFNYALTKQQIINDMNSTATVDTTPPVITLLGANPINVVVGTTYIDPGATATDDLDGNVNVTIYTGAINTANPGVYTVTFNATDAAGNQAETKTRTVNVVESVDTQDPVITLLGANPIEILIGTEYIEPGATAVDAYGISVAVVITGTVDTTTIGSYPIYYTATDARGNTDSVRRFVNVVAASSDVTPPVITLLGANQIDIIVGTEYNEPGATATDSIDGIVSVIISGVVDTTTIGTYTKTYTATDAAGNQASATRTINVVAQSSLTPLEQLLKHIAQDIMEYIETRT